MNDKTEIRTFIGTVESRAVDPEDNKITIVGKPVVFNAKTDIGGWWEESIAPGAIDEKTLRDVRLLVNHDFDGIPLARSRRNNKNSTMRLSIVEDGVEMEADLDNDTVIANILADEKIAKFLEKNGGNIVKTIVVKNKLVNLIVK